VITLPTTKAMWPIKGSKDVDFAYLFLKEKQVNCHLNFFLKALMMSSKNIFTLPSHPFAFLVIDWIF